MIVIQSRIFLTNIINLMKIQRRSRSMLFLLLLLVTHISIRHAWMMPSRRKEVFFVPRKFTFSSSVGSRWNPSANYSPCMKKDRLWWMSKLFCNGNSDDIDEVGNNVGSIMRNDGNNDDIDEVGNTVGCMMRNDENLIVNDVEDDICHASLTSSNWEEEHNFLVLEDDDKSMKMNPLSLNLLLIDNYDSYTNNLYQHFMGIVSSVTLIKNDDYESYSDYLSSGHPVPDCVVIGPGPGSPNVSTDVGICRDVIESPDAAHMPILGVCLGHQLLGLCYGATVSRAKVAKHGLVSSIINSSEHNLYDELFEHLPDSLRAVRYHSLSVQTNEDDDVVVLATAEDDGEIMALAHKTFPHIGYQFHPESIGTYGGVQLLYNFCKFAMKYKHLSDTVINENLEDSSIFSEAATRRTKCIIYKVDRAHALDVDAEAVFEALYASSNRSTFWLDSSSNNKSGSNIKGNDDALFSMMGESFDHTVEYFIRNDNYGSILRRELLIHHHRRNETITLKDERLMNYLRNVIEPNGYEEVYVTSLDNIVEKKPTFSVPFEYRGGYVGFLGYEMRHDPRHTSVRYSNVNDDDDLIPDATLAYAKRSIVFDHSHDDIYLVCLLNEEDDEDYNESISWMQDVQDRLKQVSKDNKQRNRDNFPYRSNIPLKGDQIKFKSNRSRREYEKDISMCHELIRAGESYEICLTNQSTLPLPLSSNDDTHYSLNKFSLYKNMRRSNPAPFSSYMNIQGRCAVCCSSPERFLRVDADGNMESKPIKGTSQRSVNDCGVDDKLAHALRHSKKNRAENLMIVDLLRNDFGRVCRSVVVSKLMEIESYETVHQLVSTIQGQLDSDKYHPIDALEACFPGGSMTGAPKLRTMDIIHDLERGQKRGIYSGSLGYFSPNGSIDMNIVIRTAIVTDKCVRVGAGGAVTMLSTPGDEYEEMMLKGMAIRDSIANVLQMSETIT